MDHAPPPPRARSRVPSPAVAGGRAGGCPPLPAPELIEHLVVATHDLDRLQHLLDDAGQALVTHFQAAATQMKLLRRAVTARPDMDARPLEVAMDHLSAAITSLQFRDLAAQLLEQAGARLRDCAMRLGGEDMPPPPCPAQQTAFEDTVRLGFAATAMPDEIADTVPHAPTGEPPRPDTAPAAGGS